MYGSFRNARTALGLLLVLVNSCTIALAQFSSSVQGTISDSSGAVIPDADVTLTNRGNNSSVHTHSNASGVYRFGTLPAGAYILRVHREGFSDTREDISITTDEVAGANVALRPGSATTTVEVTQEAPILNPEETRTQYTLSGEELHNLPVQNSATLGFVRLAPGSTGVVEGLNNLNENRNLPEANANGLDSASNLYTLDNVPITSSQNYASSFNGNVAGAIVFVPNLSAIGEVALQTTTFAVSYGTQASQILAFNTKSGTNTWHGIFDESYGDRVLNASAFNVVPGTQHRHIFSGGIGGPLIKDRLFFWGSAEHRGEIAPAGSGAGQYFTPQFANFISNPANDPNQISVTAFIKNAPNSRARYSSSPSDQTAAQYFGGCKDGETTTSYNTPCNMLVTQNAIENGAHFLHGENYSGRLDYNLRGGKDKLYAFYYGSTQLSDSESIAPAFDGYTPTHGKAASLNYTTTVSPSIVNQATFGYWDFRFDFQTTPHSRNMVQLPFLFLNLGVGNFTRFVPFIDAEKQFYGRDTVLIQKGKHYFNVGVEAANNVSYDDRTGIYTRPLLYLWFTHQSFFDDQLDLLIVANYYSGVSGKHIGAISAATNTRFGVYVQDSWKLRPNLTLTYGLRYDDLGNPEPTQNTIPFANILSNVPSGTVRSSNLVNNLRIGRTPKAYAGAQNINIDPRIGFAWAPMKSNYTTVLRGGFGLYQDLANLEIVAGQVTSNPPGIIGYTHCCGGAVGYGTNQDASQGFGFTNVPLSITPPKYNADGSVVGQQANIQGVDPHIKPQRAILWDLSVEHEFAAKIAAALTYTGSYSYNLTYSADLNRPNGNATIDLATNKESANYANPNFGGISPYIGGLKSNANLLTAALRQNLRGIDWQASYTWEHILGSPDGFGTNGIVDSYNPEAQYGNANFDVRNSFKLSALTPIRTHFTNRVAQTLLNGFAINNVFIGQTGEPFTVYFGNQAAATDFARNDKGYQIPNYTGPRSFSRTQWKNGIFPVSNNTADCGGLPTPCYVGFSKPTGAVGNQGNNSFRNAGYFTWDANVQRGIDLPWLGGERSTLTLRVDGFNIPNRFNPSPIQLNNLGNPGGQQIDGGTGPVTTGSFQARILQLGARFEF